MPPVSRFGGGREKKKKAVITRLQGFFDKFYGVGGAFYADEKKLVTYGSPDFTSEALVADPRNGYTEKDL